MPAPANSGPTPWRATIGLRINMNHFSGQDQVALQRSVECDARTMQLIANFTPEQAQAMAQQSLNRRASFIFDMLTNESLQSIAKGEIDMPQVCAQMLGAALRDTSST